MLVSIYRDLSGRIPRPTDDPAAATALEASRGRVEAMALLHERLSFEGGASHVDFSSYLRGLLRMLEDLHGEGGSVAADVEDSLELPLDNAIPCSSAARWT